MCGVLTINSKGSCVQRSPSLTDLSSAMSTPLTLQQHVNFYLFHDGKNKYFFAVVVFGITKQLKPV